MTLKTPHICPTCHQPTSPPVLKDVVALRPHGRPRSADVYILSIDAALDILASYDCHPRCPFDSSDYDWSTAWTFSSAGATPSSGVDKS